MRNDTQLRRHHKRFHDKSVPDITFSEDGKHGKDMGVEYPDDGTILDSKLIPLAQVDFIHMNQNCKRFFGRQHQCNGGVPDLISRVYFNGEAPPAEINPPDRNLGLLMLLLSTRLTREELEIFSKILSLFQEVIDSRVQAEKMRLEKEQLLYRYCISFPTLAKSLREMVFRRKNSFSEIIPVPSVSKIGEHSYASLSSVISNFLANEFAYQQINDCADVNSNEITCLSNSPMAKKVLSRAQQRLENLSFRDPSLELVTLYLTDWSDAFEPNSVKSNRGSIWAMTVSISPIGVGRQNTYPIAFGPAKGDRSELDRQYQKELLSFSKGPLQKIYNGRTKTMCYVHAELIASIQDQPERREATSIAAGKSLHTSRYGYLINLQKVVDVVVPCNECRKVLMETEFEESNQERAWSTLCQCPECVAWDFDSPNKRRLLRAIPPKDFPIDQLSSDGKYGIKECTFTGMQKAIKVAHQNMIENKWSATSARVYLSTEGINESMQKTIIEHARCCIAHAYYNSNGELRDSINRDKELHPDMYEMCKGNPRWDLGIEVWQHVEAVMHLVFHGIQKHLMRAVERWASLNGSQSSLHRFGKGTLEPIQALSLDWCKPIPYNGEGFGGWLAENYLAMARLSPWFYSQLDKLGEDETYPGDPTNDPIYWNKKQNAAWLRARGLPVPGKISASELKEIVLGHLSRDNPPVIIPKPAITAKDVMSLLDSAHRMFRLVMARSVTREYILRLDLQIKTFLTKFHEFDAELKSNEAKKNPAWISSYNFICLLNLPRMAKEYGPLRNLWEGGYLGEGFIRHVKPHAKHGFRKNWEINLHKNVLKEKFLSACLKDTNRKGKERSQVRYSTRAEIESGLICRNVLSCVRLLGEKLAFSLTDQRQIGINLEYKCTVNNLDYFNVSLGALETNIDGNDDALSSCLLLPNLTGEGLPNLDDAVDSIGYAIVDSEWNYFPK